MIIPNEATIAVADGRNVRLFRNKGAEPHLRLVSMPDPDLEVISQGSGARHRSSAANPDEQRIREDDFALTVAEYLNRQVLEGGIEALIVVADPRTLGEMRRHFSPVARSKIVGEIAKDLTGHAVGHIEATLRKA